MGHYLPGMEPDAEPGRPDGAGDEWYTPPKVLRAVEAVSPGGAIDLDPCHAPRSLVQARHTIDTRRGGDGLRDAWQGAGMVFCNPPYSNVMPWMSRCRHEAERRPVVMLVPLRAETAHWHEHVWGGGAHVVIPRGRIPYVGADGQMHGAGMIATVFVVWDRALAVALARALSERGIAAVAVGRA